MFICEICGTKNTINLWGPLFDRIGRKEICVICKNLRKSQTEQVEKICVICVTKKAQKDCKKSHNYLAIEPQLSYNRALLTIQLSLN